jgi:hypothetical protein
MVLHSHQTGRRADLLHAESLQSCTADRVRHEVVIEGMNNEISAIGWIISY